MEDANEPLPVGEADKLGHERGSNHSTADMISTDGEFEERLPLDDEDIEKAAEQVVEEWTERLQGSSKNMYDEVAENEGVGEVGAMNHELPAGGYEEVVMGYDETENAELIEEEVYDESYSEELVYDDEDMMIDNAVEEVMEEAVSIINQEDQEQAEAEAQERERRQQELPPDDHSDMAQSEEQPPGVQSESAQNHTESAQNEEPGATDDVEVRENHNSPEVDNESQSGEQGHQQATPEAHEPSTPEESETENMANLKPALPDEESETPTADNEKAPEVEVNRPLEESVEQQLNSPKLETLDPQPAPAHPVSHPVVDLIDEAAEDAQQTPQTPLLPVPRKENHVPEEQYSHESIEKPDKIVAPKKRIHKAAQSKSRPQQEEAPNTAPLQVISTGHDDSSAAIPDSDIEAGMDVPPGPPKKNKWHDDYDSSSSDDSDDLDELCPFGGKGFVLCFCCIALIVVIVCLAVILTRRGEAEEATLTPTMMPTVSPTSALPTMAPTSTILSWASSLDDVHGPELSQFGSAIALDDNFYVVGAPKENTTGAVFTALFEEPHWNLLPVLYGEDEDDNFGDAVDMRDGYLIVGAPNRKANGTMTMVGEAYVYIFQPNTKRWLKVGPTLKSDQDIFSAGGEFGKSVAVGVGRRSRVVVGAPKHNKDATSLVSGRVYTFESTGKSWNSLDMSKQLLGKRANDLFGAAVDMTDSGNRFIVGAPGANDGAAGYVQIFEWNGSEWVVDFEVEGDSGDSFGTTVVSLTDTDDVFIVGAPGHRSGRGKIVVYRRQSPNTYIQLGPDIVGDVNDSLGKSGSINGGLEDGAILLVFASLDGEVRTFTFENSSNTWLQRALPLNTGYSTVNVDYSEEDGLLVSDSDEDKALLYEASDVTVTSIDTFEGQESLPIKYVP